MANTFSYARDPDNPQSEAKSPSRDPDRNIERSSVDSTATKVAIDLIQPVGGSRTLVSRKGIKVQKCERNQMRAVPVAPRTRYCHSHTEIFINFPISAISTGEKANTNKNVISSKRH